ncbi:MAG: Adenylate cyclase [Pelotomaculum sp. PtaB.Bin104]|nr:MAG: Adenylate cyclase [Pelotomaculum sp. PtaB.Bin104]
METSFHLIFVFVFMLMGVSILSYVNILSVLTYLLNILLNRKRMFLLCGAIALIEIIVHQCLCVFFIGWEAGFQYYIFTVPMLAFIVQNKYWYSIFFTIFAGLIYSLLYIFFSTGTPIYYLPEKVLVVLHTSNLVGTIFVLAVITYFYGKAIVNAEQALQIQFDRAELLLANILPKPVAERLKERQQMIADGFAQVSILFADIHKFTEFSSGMNPNNLVLILNNLFSSYDDIVEKYGIEKIKTIGDAYMVTSGLPVESDHHAEYITDFAFDMLKATNEFNEKYGTKFSVRIGINSGPVTAGIIGKKKFIYDLWGDTVNVASRMESNGVPSQIHITEDTYDLIKDKYIVKKREPIEIKGKGLMQTYFVVGKMNISKRS